jgi:pyridoxamine 5'-phosphate oxidase
VSQSIDSIRKEYALKQLLEDNACENPILQFKVWLDEALDARVNEPTAMGLSTVNAEGKPSSRVVLLKEFNDQGFAFFTNRESRKGTDLFENSYACLLFFWPELERQVRVEGVVTQLGNEESDAYFLSRPRGSQIGAWASPQSQEIPSRDFLDAKTRELELHHQNKPITRPPYWGGYRLMPSYLEFWQGRPNRLHDRLIYSLDRDAWRLTRLAP